MSNRKLLLADDSITIQKVINLTFADEGIEVMAVGDGDTAMARIETFRPDIVLADVNMPGLNGYKICEHLRSSEDFADTPVILLVGSFEVFDEDEARRVKANEWMTKPFQSIRQLVSRVNILLDQKPKLVEAAPAAASPVVYDTPIVTVVPGSDNEDIDTLYRQSFSGDVGSSAHSYETTPEFNIDPTFGDAGMDDDMIETSYMQPSMEPAVSPFDAKPFTTPPENTAPLEIPESPVTEVTEFGLPRKEESFADIFGDEPAKNEPDAEDVYDLNSIVVEETASFESEQPQPEIVVGSALETAPLIPTEVTTEEPAAFGSFDAPTEHQQPEPGSKPESSFGFETFQIPEPPVEPIVEEPKPFSRFTSPETSPVDTSAETAPLSTFGLPSFQSLADEAANAPEIAAGSTAQTAEDLELELPDSGQVPTAEAAVEEEIIALSGSVPAESLRGENAEDVAREVSAMPGDITPEFIDEVARKVIERISENVIRQIAWQVVPQIAESVLREKTK